METAPFANLVRAVEDGADSRRGFVLRFGATAFASILALATGNEVDARRRGKKRKGKKRRGGNNGERDRCRFDRCDGQCVDLDSDPNNCGVCGEACPEDTSCVGGLCVFAFGTSGSGNRQFDGPAGVAFDRIGFSFAADANNARVAIFAGAQSFKAFGQRGEGDGQFLEPAAVTVDGSGEIFVTDAQRHRIQRFDADGGFELGGGSFGSGPGQFNAPRGIADSTRTGLLYVADTGNHSIQRVTRNFIPVDRLGRRGSGDGEFESPQGVTLANGGRMIVADTGNHRVQVLEDEGAFIRAFGRQGSGAGEFNSPTAVAVDRISGDILVVDQGNNRLQRFTKDGEFLNVIGRLGTGVGEFDEPVGIAVADQGFFVVSDRGNDRVQFLFPASLVDDESASLNGLLRMSRTAAKRQRSARNDDADRRD